MTDIKTPTKYAKQFDRTLKNKARKQLKITKRLAKAKARHAKNKDT
jgi:hypothetical protein